VSVNDDYSCAVRDDDRVVCWGFETDEADDEHTPYFGRRQPPEPGASRRHVPGSSVDLRQISAGSTYSCGVTTDDRALCWGITLNGAQPPHLEASQ
jgi:alpha-tubulin suppressor-like RCC1 family protein